MFRLEVPGLAFIERRRKFLDAVTTMHNRYIDEIKATKSTEILKSVYPDLIRRMQAELGNISRIHRLQLVASFTCPVEQAYLAQKQKLEKAEAQQEMELMPSSSDSYRGPTYGSMGRR
jgi:hypothetical protein